jgi:hypothetical protein
MFLDMGGLRLGFRNRHGGELGEVFNGHVGAVSFTVQEL